MVANSTKGTNPDAKVTRVPGPIAIALMTGRPELARVGMQETPGTPEFHRELCDFAESIVKDIQAERELVSRLYLAVHDTVSQLRGSLSAMERLQETLQMINHGADPQQVQDSLRNPKRKEPSNDS